MKITCYCIGCPKHPLFSERSKHRFVHINNGRTIWRPEEKFQGKEVECFTPSSFAFDELDIDNPESLPFKEVAYGDGCSISFASGDGYDIAAVCENETYVENE